MFQVFSATNVELVTKTRTEHLTDADKEKSSPRSPIQSFLNIAEVEEKQNSPSSSDEVSKDWLAVAAACLGVTFHCLTCKCYVIHSFKIMNLIYFHIAKFYVSLMPSRCRCELSSCSFTLLLNGSEEVK